MADITEILSKEMYADVEKLVEHNNKLYQGVSKYNAIINGRYDTVDDFVRLAVSRLIWDEKMYIEKRKANRVVI